VSVAQRVKNKPELKIVVSNIPEVLAAEPAPEQVEMPFAIVNGEPVTQMPKDLYIPPQAMEVFLEAFEGPLDLLLYLIRRQNLNILDIPLAEITRQYMKYIEVMTELQLELAGEYMVMAATLAEIKSRMLLPRPKVDPEGNEEDPRAELVRRLQEYERFKRAAESIDALPRLERDVWTTSADLKDRKVVRLLPTVTLQEMLIAFKDVVVRSEMFAHHHIQRERLSVRERMGDILTTLEHASFVEFIRLFRLEEGRMGVTVTFMALLELVREGLIEIVQAEAFAPIHVRAAGASRKLHVVGGNDALGVGAEAALAADGASAGAAAGSALAAAGAFAGEAPGGALAAGSALADGSAVVGEAVAGDAPGVGVWVPAVDDDLARFAEPALDPDFVDDSEDDLDAGLLEGVDGVVDLVAPSGLAGGVADDEVTLETGLAATDLSEASPVDAGEVTDVAAVAPIVSLDDSGEDVGSAPVFGEGAHAFGPTAALDEAAADVEFAPVGLAEAGSAEGVVVVDLAPLSEVVQGDESASPSDVVVAAGEPAVAEVLTSVAALEFIPAGLGEAGANDSVVIVEAAELPSVAGEFAELSNVAVDSAELSDGVVDSAPFSDVVATGVAAGEMAATDVADAAASAAAASHEAPVAVADAPAAVGELPHALTSDVEDIAVAFEPSLTGDPIAAVNPSGTDEIALLAPAIEPTDVNEPMALDELTAATEPGETDVAASVDVAATAIEPSAADESAVTVDPTLFAPPAATTESEPSGDTPLDEPAPFDVEYAVPADEIASGEQSALDDDVSLVGDTPVAGEVSLIGDESVSGGPAVEVEEFAFDELPALDEMRQADQQPAAGAQTVVNENAGTDEPPSPGEESDD